MSDSYYELLDATEDGDTLSERFRATDLARSTWSADIQHGAPVSALLARALERRRARPDTRLSRVSVDLLGGVPAEGEFQVHSTVERSGKQIELISAEMLGPDRDGTLRPVARAGGWRLQTTDTTALVHAPEPPLRPVEQATARDMAKQWDRNYVHSVDWRWLTDLRDAGPGESWIKPVVDLVQGEQMTPLQRMFCVADCANGLGNKLDIRKWTFMNTDLVVHLYRLPEGEWTGIRAETSYGPDGVGTTLGTLFDERGPLGAVQQSVLLRARPQKA